MTFGGRSSSTLREYHSQSFRLTVRSCIESRKGENSEALSSNALAILCPLANLPQKPDDINTFFCPHLETPPASATPTSKAKKAKKDAEAAPADWTAYYDSPSEDDDDTPTGKKRKRTRFMSVLEGIHSVESHKQVFTSVWLEVLGLPYVLGLSVLADFAGFRLRRRGRC